MSILLKNVSKIYKMEDIETIALKNINLEINDGEFVVILGPSGSGKSTLLNVISGLDSPTEGEIFFNDIKISDYNEEELTKFRRDYIGYVFQQYNLLHNLTVRENVEIGSAVSKDSLGVDEVLRAVSMYEERNKYPYQLSGGQQQRVSIARSIAKNPKIMFCDEPTGALDEKIGKQILNIIQVMNKNLKTTTVVITHNKNISYMADTIIKMNSGKIVEVIKNEEKRKASEILWG